MSRQCDLSCAAWHIGQGPLGPGKSPAITRGGLGRLPNHVLVFRNQCLLQLHHRGEDPLYL